MKGIDSESDDASISVSFFFCCPLIIYGMNHLIQRRICGFRIKHIKDFVKDTEVELYINSIIDMIKKRSTDFG